MGDVQRENRRCDWFWCDETGRYDGLCLRHFEKASAIAAAERGDSDGDESGRHIAGGES